MEQIYNYFSELLVSNQFLQGGFVLGALTWLGYQLKTIPQFLGTKIRYYATYTIHFDQSSEFYRVFSEWLNETHPAKFRNVEIKFHGENERNTDEPQTIASSDTGQKRKFELKKLQFSDANVIRHKGRWLWVTKDRARLDTARDVRSMFYHSYTVSGLFAKSAIDDLCAQIELRKNAEIAQDELRVWFNETGYFQSESVSVIKSFDHLFFEDKAKLVADLDTFTAQKEMYFRKGIKYKRAYLFYGPGGTGKTSIGLAIAKYLDHDLYVISLSSITNDLELQRLGTRIRKHAVVMLEDIDCILSERKMKTEKLNFGTVLNFLDGLYAPADCIFVMTTNKPDDLDDALTRKGRVDLALQIDFPHVSEVQRYMSDFYDTDVRLPLATGTKAFYGMSAVQDICLQNDLETAKALVLGVFIRPNGHKRLSPADAKMIERAVSN